MSKNDIYEDRPIEPTYFPQKIFTPYNSNYNSLDNQFDLQFNYTQPLPNYNNIIRNEKRNQSLYNLSQDVIDKDNNYYLKERYSKVKEENAELKRKLLELERDYKIKKGEMEEQILILRDENSNLQLQIQKIIEKQKVENNISDNIHNENLALINDLNILQNDSIILKDDITRKIADIEEKNKIINDLRNEKIIFLNDQKSMKNQIESLNKDKEYLIKQIKDLNDTIEQKIAPKLKENEISLSKLQEQSENLRVENEKLKSDNLLLFNENNIQKNLIQILTKQNKKLLGEIKIIYDRDILLMDNMEKIGSNTSYKYQKIFDKNTIENDNMFDEEMNILKDSQKYLDEKNDTKEMNKKENSIDKNYINIDNDNEDNNDNEYYFKNQYKINKNKREINSIIDNDIIVKRNKESLDLQNNLNKKNNPNSTDTHGITKEKISFHKIDISNLIKTRDKYHKNKVKNRNYNYNSQSFTDGNITPNKFTELDEDIKIENKTLNQNINHKNLIFNNDFNFNEDRGRKNCLYNTDGRVSRKNIKSENFGKIRNKFVKDDNEYDKNGYKTNNDNTYSNNLNIYNTNNINPDGINNLLKISTTKSQLSEYVEDLDVIEYK